MFSILSGAYFYEHQIWFNYKKLRTVIILTNNSTEFFYLNNFIRTQLIQALINSSPYPL